MDSPAFPMRKTESVILVGEDNRTVGRVISKILEKDGHRIHYAATGPEALQALLNARLDLALLDANLTGMDAVEITHLYRFGSVGRQHLPILGLVGEMSAPALSAWMDAGLDGCIGKPIEPIELLDAVNSHLQANEPSHAEKPAAAEDAGPTLAVDGRVLRDLEKLGGQSFVDEIITQFVADASRLLPELSGSAGSQDTGLFRDNVHALRSCAGNVGAVGLYKLCLASQSMSPRELIGEGSQYVARLQAEFERAVVALDQHEWRQSAA
jgi:two-component system sensor histidine kinase RpfC